MAYLVGIPLLIVLAILQTTVFADIHFFDGRPDIVLLAVIGWGLAGGDRQGMVWGLIGGLLLDSFSGLPLGSSAISLILIAFLVSLYAERVWEANLLMPIGIALGASLIFHFLSLGWLFTMGRNLDLPFSITRVILPTSILNMILILPIYQLMYGLHRRLYPPEIEI
jgi:rod shape-determining protein MreD